MAVTTEGIHTGEYLVTEVDVGLSRNTDTLILGQDLVAGTVLGRITASGKLTRHAHGAADGSEAVAGILYDNVNAVADTTVVYTKRLSVVRESSLTFSAGAAAGDITTAIAELDVLNIAMA